MGIRPMAAGFQAPEKNLPFTEKLFGKTAGALLSYLGTPVHQD
jgi:hypothetical protein